MCGIAGFISPNYSQEQLARLTSSIKHRGPDAEGFYFDAPDQIGLGHLRLSIIDLSAAANQPFYSQNGRYVMIYNGEIYNYAEVRDKYGIRPRTHSDSEILLEAFALKGIDCLQDMNGMFAVAIWDKEEKQLTLMRDRFGKKPIVWYQKGSDFAFASELKALMALPIEKKINKQALQDYLYLEYIPEARSILKNCHKLPRGHYMTVKDGKVNVRPYYIFRDQIQARPLPERKDSEVLDEFESLLSSAVQLRQVSDVPIGAFLSGGTDSSLICALFQKQNSDPVNTFTIGFDVKGYDESAYARRVADLLRTNHKETHLSDRSSIEIVDRLPKYYDEPFAAPSTIPSYLVCREARKFVTVAMSGDGGDELFMGYGYYDLYRKIKTAFRIDPGVGRMTLSALFRAKGGRFERAARIMQLPKKDLFAHLWSEQQYMYSEKEIGRLLNTETHLTIKEEWRKIDAMPLSDNEKISLFDIEQYLAYNLLYKMDSASMANSLEVRNPYLDYRLMEYSYNLPESFKIRNGTAKYLMKKLLCRYLPDDIVYRRKWGFPAPIGNWLLGELSYLIDKWLEPSLIRSQGIFNEQMVSEYVRAFRSGKTWHDKRIWSLIFFQAWYYEYINN